MAKKGQTGQSLGGLEISPQRARRRAQARKREEKRWQKKNGPVTVRFVDPATLRQNEEKRPAARPQDASQHSSPLHPRNP